MDELRSSIRLLELRASDATAEIAALQRERDNLLTLYTQTNQQLGAARSSGTAAVRGTTDGVARKLEAELRLVREKVRAVEGERDSFHYELQQLRQDMHRATAEVNAVRTDRDALAVAAAGLREKLVKREQLAASTQASLEEARAELARSQESVRQLQSLVAQEEAARSSEAVARDRESASSGDAVAALREQLAAAKSQCAARDAENQALVVSLRELDEERDALQGQLDAQLERMAAAEEAEGATRADMVQQTLSAQEQQATLALTTTELAEKRREVASLQRRVGRMEEAAEAGEAERGEMSAVMKGLQTDLDTLTRENELVNRELSESLQQRATLQEQLRQFHARGDEIETLIKQREAEKAELYEQYNIISARNSKLEACLHDLEQGNDAANSRLAEEQDNAGELAARFDALQGLCQQQQDDLWAFEVQTSKLTAALSQMEEQLRLVQAEKEVAEHDLSAARSLSLNLGKGREDLMRQVAR